MISTASFSTATSLWEIIGFTAIVFSPLVVMGFLRILFFLRGIRLQPYPVNAPRETTREALTLFVSWLFAALASIAVCAIERNMTRSFLIFYIPFSLWRAKVFFVKWRTIRHTEPIELHRVGGGYG